MAISPASPRLVRFFTRTSTGAESASWLVICHNGAWVVACCAEGTVSPTRHSLADALAVIHPAQTDGGARSLLC